jgi:AcrR family transcriptional regulator
MRIGAVTAADHPLSAQGTRLNRRGLETRARVLDVALTCLAEGPEAASANLVARRAEVTWGTLQHQFGDVDGLWAAVLDHAAPVGPLLGEAPAGSDVADRVGQVVDLLWAGLERPWMRALLHLRLALPSERADLEAAYPRTAAALRAWDERWDTEVRTAFAAYDVDPVRLRRVRGLLPGAVRGLHLERRLSTYADADDARRGLAEALGAYLGGAG